MSSIVEMKTVDKTKGLRHLKISGIHISTQQAYGKRILTYCFAGFQHNAHSYSALKHEFVIIKMKSIKIFINPLFLDTGKF